MCLYFVIRFNSLIFPLFYVIPDHITSSVESVPVYLDIDVNLYIFSGIPYLLQLVVLGSREREDGHLPRN